MKRWSKDSSRLSAILPVKSNQHDMFPTSTQPGLGWLKRQTRAYHYTTILVLSTSCKTVDRESTRTGSLNSCLSWVRPVGGFTYARLFSIIIWRSSTYGIMPLRPGAGKSTVIKMLINREHSRVLKSRDRFTDPFPVPVPGLVGDTVPTTGDVHLYPDPGTYYAQKPILYADCEGLTGGENTPRGMASQLITDTAKKGKNKLRKRISWANNPKMQSREFAVSSLFPRILYTFSDVVVFVLREAR